MVAWRIYAESLINGHGTNAADVLRHDGILGCLYHPKRCTNIENNYLLTRGKTPMIHPSRQI